MLFRFDDGTRIEVNCASAEALLKAIADRLRRGEGFAGATINIDHLDQIGRDAAFRRAYAAQDLVVADGNPVVWLSRIAGRPVSLAPGSDLVVPIARVAAEAAAPVALIGSTPQALAAAADALRAAAPGLDIVLCVSPGFPFDPEGEEADAILGRLGAAGVRLAFLALGAPRQERLAARGRLALPGCGFVSVGAGLDFLSGHQRRAPRWVRRARMEWLWRAAGNPRRLALRYARGFTILPGHAWRALRLRRETAPPR